MTTLDDAAVFIPRAGTLCEGPVWVPRDSRLVWVDILAGLVHAADPVTAEQERWELGTPVGAVAPRNGGGWVAALERGFAVFSEDWTLVGDVAPAPGQAPGTRFNDGKCDPSGRFWAGTLAYDGTARASCLYRFDPDGGVTEVIDGVTISNGLGWSLDGETMYFVDTGQGTVDAMRFDGDTGTPSERRTLVAVPPEEGAPDGLTVDAEGFLWVALWDGGAIRRYSPDGELVMVIKLPVARVTSMAFGGAELADLFVTTASDGLDDDQLAAQPLAGSVFRTRPGPTGLPPVCFAG